MFIDTPFFTQDNQHAAKLADLLFIQPLGKPCQGMYADNIYRELKAFTTEAALLIMLTHAAANKTRHPRDDRSRS
jgi:hypothetical protein